MSKNNNNEWNETQKTLHSTVYFLLVFFRCVCVCSSFNCVNLFIADKKCEDMLKRGLNIQNITQHKQKDTDSKTVQNELLVRINGIPFFFLL